MSSFARRLLAVVPIAFFLVAVSTALAAPKMFLNSDDAKERDEPQKFLQDYDKLVEGKDSDWVYFPNGSLKSLKSVRVNDFENNGRDRDSKDAAREGKEYMEQWLEKEGFEIVEKGPADLTIDGQRFQRLGAERGRPVLGRLGRQSRRRAGADDQGQVRRDRRPAPRQSQGLDHPGRRRERPGGHGQVHLQGEVGKPRSKHCSQTI